MHYVGKRGINVKREGNVRVLDRRRTPATKYDRLRFPCVVTFVWSEKTAVLFPPTTSTPSRLTLCGDPTR